MVKNVKDTLKDFVRVVILEEKSPVVAFLLSATIPGLGQYYNGEISKGVMQDLLFIGRLLLSYGSFNYRRWIYEQPFSFYAGFCLAGGSWIWSILDAPLSATKINKKMVQQRMGYLIEFSKDKYTLGLDMKVNKKGIRTMFTLNF